MDDIEVSFALITEGITDQAAIESILRGHYKRFQNVELVINTIQPTRDATDTSMQGNFAGWEKVLETCSNTESITGAFQFNEYLIIQIDTDVGDHPNYGLNLAPGGNDADDKELANQAREIIAKKFGDTWPEFQNKVFTAVSIHSLECWLLALHEKNDPCPNKNCENRLQRSLNKKEIEYRKDYRSYQELSKGFQKTKNLDDTRNRCVSLDKFVKSLPTP